MIQWQSGCDAKARYFHRTDRRRYTVRVNLLTEDVSIILRIKPSRSNFSRRSALRCRQRPSARRLDESLPLSIRFRSAPEMRRHSHKAARCRDAVGTVPFRKSAHVQWKSTVRRNESVGNWHRAPGTGPGAGHQRVAID